MTQSYEGGCHCGAVRYRITADLDSVMACNCSICAKEGWLLTFVGSDAFALLRGEEALRDYQFGKQHIHHKFCTTCGIRSFSHGEGPDGTTTYSINVRCLEDVNAESLPVTRHDGRHA